MHTLDPSLNDEIVAPGTGSAVRNSILLLAPLEIVSVARANSPKVLSFLKQPLSSDSVKSLWRPGYLA